MKIAVSVKQVPDTAAQVVVEDGQITWGDASLIINPWDEYAVEAALQGAKAQGGSVTVISMGPEDATEGLKHALAMGCDEAVYISDPALKGLDSVGAARVLAAAIEKLGGVDLVFFGKQAVDSDSGMMASQVARVLGWTALPMTSAITELSQDSITVERSIEEGLQVVTSQLPATVSMTKDFGEPRYPSFMGIRKASRAQYPVWTLEDLGIEAPTSVVSWPEVMNPPEREIVTEMITGDSPEEIAEKLADKIMEEKVL